VTILETTAYRAPLGLLCTDSVSGAAVADGLVVTAWPAGNPEAARTPVPSPVSAVLVFGRLPGLTSTVLANDPHSPQWPAASLAFEVRVTDPLGRYLPELMLVTVTGGTLASARLYSAPARPAPAGFAVVSGEVWSTVTSRPAPWAVVKIKSGTDFYLTLADQLGRYVAYFPYPEALPPLTGSPPTAAAGRLSWPLSVLVQYQPSKQHQLADAGPADPPELSSLLNQGAAKISAGGGTQDDLAATLTFGSPLPLMLKVAA
jgi:hypothetical protein